MEIIPEIYILDGKCVALYKGDYAQKEIYREKPVQVALRFQKEGADKIYIADLNGKQLGGIIQKDVIKKIINAVSIPIILEAGIEKIEEIQVALDMGIDHVVLISPSLEFASEAIKIYGPEKIFIQLFAQRAELIEKREKKYADDVTDVVDYAEKLVPVGVKYVIYKDKRSEGTLIHPNYDEIDRLVLTTGENLKIYSSGGISEVIHIKTLKEIGAAGAIIGKALFERMITINEAERQATNHNNNT